MRVAITGAAGFFGQAITRAVARAGHSVLVIDRSWLEGMPTAANFPHGQVEAVTADVTDRDSLIGALTGDIDVVIHAAALTPTQDQQQEQPERLVDVNLGGTISMLAAARHIETCRKFIYISSVAVFEQGQIGQLREADATGGDSLYGTTKIAAEYVVHRYGQLFGMQTVAVRPTSLYGPGEQLRPTRPFVSAVQQLVEGALRGQPMRIEGLESRGDWINADHAAEVVSRLVSAEGIGSTNFNLSSGYVVPFSEIVGIVDSLVPLHIDPHASYVVNGGSDRPAIIVNERLRTALNWQPSDLRTGLEHYISALSGNRQLPAH
ncbi:MAG: NAD(P)-dependent oxidoreductase [Chloroflexi bacterium]|nr:NAD(P)-dependent oxidoreductase [Chloroflexota bacterium]